MLLLMVHTVVEELHAKGQFTLESIDLQALFFKASKEVLKLLGLIGLISDGFQKHGVAAGLALKAQLGRRSHSI